VLADPGVKIELVASEPLVQDPVAIAFDGAGRLWVVEMLSFMQDIDGTGEDERIGRISVLFDDDGDGRMDRNKVFLDSLLLPRAVGLVEGGILVAENIPLWYAEDTDGDFRADRVSLVDSTYGGSGMPEHSANGLWRGMDNWIYNAKSKYQPTRQ
jgi:putative membrane-bound dehydrogenase-like protein